MFIHHFLGIVKPYACSAYIQWSILSIPLWLKLFLDIQLVNEDLIDVLEQILHVVGRLLLQNAFELFEHRMALLLYVRCYILKLVPMDVDFLVDRCFFGVHYFAHQVLVCGYHHFSLVSLLLQRRGGVLARIINSNAGALVVLVLADLLAYLDAHILSFSLILNVHLLIKQIVNVGVDDLHATALRIVHSLIFGFLQIVNVFGLLLAWIALRVD